MPRLLRAARLLPVLTPPLDDGALLIDGDRLLDVGPFGRLRKAHPGVAVEDLGEAIVLPPLVNAHTHLELTHFPQWAAELPAPDSFVGWIQQVIQVKRGLEIEQIRASLQEGIRQCLQLGTGFVGDILSLHKLGQAYHDAPLMGRLFYETLGVDPARTREQLDHAAGYLTAGHVGHMQTGLSPHSPFTLSQDYLKQALHTAHAAGWPVATHLAESVEETLFTRLTEGPIRDELYPYVGWQDETIEPHGLRPWPYLVKFEGGQAGDLLAHGVQVEPEDVLAMAEAGVRVVLCPRSNALLDVGTAPVGWYRAVGVPLALGTDSLASNQSLSLWDEMEFALTVYEGGLSPEHLLQLATVDGAEALGRDRTDAALVPDSAAHFQVLRPAELPPVGDLADFLCRGERGAEVEQLVLHGVSRLPSVA